MHETHVGAVDLNLLPALDALLRERHVTRAADAVGLTQPAMSRTLGRLRRTFGDELLVRGPDGLQLTPRATRLQQQLADVLPRLESLVGPERFDPATAQGRVRVTGTDYAVGLLVREVLPDLLAQAPGIAVEVRAWNTGSFDALRRGELDLVLFGGQTAEDLRAETVLTEPFVCVVDAERGPDVGRLRTYLAAEHVVVDVDGTGQPAVDEPLRTRGRRRRARLTLPDHGGAMAALLGTPLVATIPEGFARAHADPSRHRLVPAPREVPDLVYKLLWHPATEADGPISWVRQLIRGRMAVAGEGFEPSKA